MSDKASRILSLNRCPSKFLVRSKIGTEMSVRIGTDMELKDVTISKWSLPPGSYKT
jgi:hypothetical protein